MRKIHFFLLLAVIAVALFTGCSGDYMRNLKIINNTEDDIISYLYINYYVTEPRKISTNALRDDHTIGPQESMDFRLGPYPEEIHIEIRSYQIDPLTMLPAVDGSDNIIYNVADTYVVFENIVPGRGKIIEATYVLDTVPVPDEYSIELGGDGYQAVQ